MSAPLQDLRELYRRLTAEPIMVAVWCVDRPGAVSRIRDLIGATAPAPDARSFASECPVYEWYSFRADADEWAKRPACFRIPGVYAQMSTGEYRRMDV